VLVVPVGEDGAAGEPTEVARTPAGSQPVGLALGVSGRLYLSLAGLGAVVVLGPDGTEVGRFPAGEDRLDGPAGLAFRGSDLLVAVRTAADPAGGRIVRFAVDEAGGPVHGGRRR
jgi:sugar lactone lactonase YvrE